MLTETRKMVQEGRKALLAQAEARYQRASQRAEAERVKRNVAIGDAVQAGLTHAQIAEAMGMSRARVGQIALWAAHGDRMREQGRYECPKHGDTLREQQALGPYCYECHGRVDPVISRG
jgi:hypothetical protein